MAGCERVSQNEVGNRCRAQGQSLVRDAAARGLLWVLPTMTAGK